MVFAATPWPEKLVEDLAAGFTQRGVEAVGVTDREFVPRETVVSTRSPSVARSATSRPRCAGPCNHTSAESSGSTTRRERCYSEDDLRPNTPR